MSEKQINNFSLISRLFGNLFYRSPTDKVLADAFVWLQQKGLSQVWALDTDKESELVLNSLQVKIDLNLLNEEYQKLFGANGKVMTAISAYDIDVEEFVNFRLVRNMPEVESADHFALVAQQEFFETFLLPCAAKFLTQVENQATLPFYRALALLTREILAAMADELEEE